jgi:hypothetical protein
MDSTDKLIEKFRGSDAAERQFLMLAEIHRQMAAIKSNVRFLCVLGIAALVAGLAIGANWSSISQR